MEKNTENSFDVIVIGSGMGGLTCASLMSKFYKKKVLVLEQHGSFGGYTHSFSRNGKFTWDVGLHYVGAMQEGGALKNCFDHLSAGKLKWQKMQDPFQVFVYPDLKIPVLSQPEQLQKALNQSFPECKVAIAQYFRDVKKVNRLSSLYFLLARYPKPLKRLISFLAKPWGYGLIEKTTGNYLSQLTDNLKLRGVLDSQWGDYGLPPEQSSFLIHAMVAKHYWYGAYVPVGGSQKISDTAIEQIKGCGGEAFKRHEVIEILTEGDRATGVKVRVGKRGSEEATIRQFYAPLIISNTGAKNTYTRLLKSHSQVPAGSGQASDMPTGCSAVVLFLGLKQNPAVLGIKSPIFWIYGDYDHNLNWQKRNSAADGQPQSCFVSFGANSDPEKKGYTAQIIAFGDYDHFKEWHGTARKNRGAEYDALKIKISEGLLQLANQHIPGLKDLVEFQELGSPLTMEHYSNHPKGQIYGYPAIVGRDEIQFLRAKTPLKNLYLTGADVGSVGIAGALMGGIMTLAEIYGFGIFRKAFSPRPEKV